jgi:heme-degrading monooxygenase HmoA
MSRIAKTPEPPYYAVIAPAVLRPDMAGYAGTAADLLALARTQPGFLGIEACMDGEFAIAVSYWDSLEAIDGWRRRAEHRSAKARGRSDWFEAYVTRIAKVERAY